jgi:hypothetical protein
MYQRCMIKCFSDLIGRTAEAYVNNIMVKTQRSEGLVHNLRETFDKLKTNGIKLNPEKYAFDVLGGMLFVFMVSEQGIEAI